MDLSFLSHTISLHWSYSSSKSVYNIRSQFPDIACESSGTVALSGTITSDSRTVTSCQNVTASHIMSYLFPSSGAENPVCVGPVILAAESYAGTNAFLTARLTSTSWKTEEKIIKNIRTRKTPTRESCVNPRRPRVQTKSLRGMA